MKWVDEDFYEEIERGESNHFTCFIGGLICVAIVIFLIA